MQTRSLWKFHNALYAAKAPFLEECALTFPLSSLVSHTHSCPSESHARRAEPVRPLEKQRARRKKDTATNGCSPAAWGPTHINMSERVGSKQRAHRNDDEERD